MPSLTPRHARWWATLNGIALTLTTAAYGCFAAPLIWKLLRLRDPQPADIGVFIVALVTGGAALGSGALAYGQRWVYRRLRRRGAPLDLDVRLILGLGTLVGGGLLGLWAWFVSG